MQKSKAILNLEEKMADLSPGSVRYKALDAAKSFKSSWIELGQFLFTIYREKTYKEWGYLTFEAYCSKEIGIRQNTALKLLKSYSFLEREEPAFLKREELGERKPSQIPGYESVNALRLAKESEKITPREYENLREEVLDEAKEDAEVKKKIRYILKSRAIPAEEDPESKKTKITQRLLTNLRGARNEINELDFPAKVLKEIDTLIDLLEDYQK